MAVHKLNIMSIRGFVAQKLSESIGISSDEVSQNFSDPPDPSLGDLALRTFFLAKKMKLPPQSVAAEICKKSISPAEFSMCPSGPYVNITLNTSFVCSHAAERVLSAGDSWGTSDEGRGKTVVIDYSSPNIAKPFGVGHLRSTAIGASLYRILKTAGYEVVGINHIGDWGTQFGIILAGFETEKIDLDKLGADAVRKAYEIYVKYSAFSENNPGFRDKARDWFSKLENNDTKAVKFWEAVKNSSLNEFRKTYSKLNINFDHYIGESFYAKNTDEVLKFFAEKGLSRKDQGATIVPLEEYDLPPVLLTKSDGSTLYATREIASVFYRLKTFKPSKLLYVVGNPQELHFKQLQAILEKAGVLERDFIIHVKFGHIQGMSTRKGNLVFLEDLMEEASFRALAKIEEGQHALGEKANTEELAFSIGVGAIIFNDLKNKRVRDIEFDWDRAMSFEGETGPYLQYAHARICSILRKAGKFTENPVFCSALESDEEKRLALAIDGFPDTVMSASTEFEPSVVSKYLLDLAGHFSTFYHAHRVLTGDDKIRAARLSLLKACKLTLSKGLLLLGIEPVEAM
ncbi:arginine--tRNA ligase [candidate division WOR-3 bacterium]|nr:arginine--tRNA ligase [candidate division WOR-3 bacterium]